MPICLIQVGLPIAHRAKLDGSLSQVFLDIFCVWPVVGHHLVRLGVLLRYLVTTFHARKVHDADLFPGVLRVLEWHVIEWYESPLVRPLNRLKDRILGRSLLHVKRRNRLLCSSRPCRIIRSCSV